METFIKIGFKEYSISNLGNIKNEKTGKILKPFISSGGYYQINLGLNKETGSQYVPLIHHLVALAFVDNPNNYSIVDHIDGNRLNCKADNLRWCTYLQNANFANVNKASKSAKMKGNQNAKGKRKNPKRGSYIYIYNGKEYRMSEICDELKCSKSKITESFRKNLGLVKSGELTRKIKNKK